MAATVPTHLLTEEEYLEFERKSEIKHEFFAGEIFAMAGGTANHSLIAVNTIRHLADLLEPRGCLVLNSDLRVRIEASGLYTYPDVSVVCDAPKFVGEPPDTLLNPTLIVEVLSGSREAYDRGVKFDHYRQIISLSTYLLLSQDAPRAEQFTRQTQFDWQNRVVRGIDASMELPALGITISLAKIFANIKFGSPPDRIPLHVKS
jgi:Uma2 family endonuclease